MRRRAFEVTCREGTNVAIFLAHVDLVPDGRTRVLFGGAKRDCVIIDVFPDDPDASLTAIGYDARCNLTADLVRGVGTVRLLRGAMLFIQQIFPVLGRPAPKRLVFKDKLYVPDERGRPRYSLWAVSLLQHGKTWYERHIGARAAHPKDQYAITSALEAARAPGSLPPWARMSRFLPSHVFPFVEEQYRLAASVANLVDRLRRANMFDGLREWPYAWLAARINPEMDWVVNLSDGMSGTMHVHANEVPVLPSAPAEKNDKKGVVDVFALDPLLFRRGPSQYGGQQDLFGAMTADDLRAMEEEGWM